MELGRIYKRLFEKRQKGDYGELVHLSKEEVIILMEEAEHFIKQVSAATTAELQKHNHS